MPFFEYGNPSNRVATDHKSHGSDRIPVWSLGSDQHKRKKGTNITFDHVFWPPIPITDC